MENMISYIIHCDYNGKTVEGMVIGQRNIPNKGMLLNVQVSDTEYRSLYLNKASNVTFKD